MDDLEFCKLGTTSYIFKTKFLKYSSNVVVLKLVKYKYITNETIRHETRRYKNLYNLHPITPQIYFSGDTYIVMDYISGETLSEFITNVTLIRPKVEKDLLVNHLINKLCEKLAYLAGKYDKNHFDLNPNNIIVYNLEPNDTEVNYDLCIIDFGINYLLNDSIGSSQALDKVSVFLSPESRVGFPNLQSDLYSVGVIILRMLIISKDFEYKKFDDYIDSIRLEYPIISTLLDDVLDFNPKLRLFDSQRKINQQIADNEKKGGLTNPNFYYAFLYKDLKKVVNMQFKILEIENTRNKSMIPRFWERILSACSLEYATFSNSNHSLYGYTFSIDEGDLLINKLIRVSGKWKYISECSNFLVLLGFGFLLFKYFNKNALVFIREINFIDLVSAFILVSFSIIAVNYYKNIFSSLDIRANSRIGALTLFWNRISTLYWPIPILYAFYEGKYWWAYVAFFGTFVVAINNLLNYIYALHCKKQIKVVFDSELPKVIDERIKEFSSWWFFMMVYAFVLLGFGYGLEKKWLKDEYAYLLLALATNIKMYFINCQDTALNVTKSLTYLYNRYNRSYIYSANA